MGLKLKKKNALSDSDMKKLEASRIKSDYVVEVEDLSITYETEDQTVQAVNHIDLKLKRKSVLGIVGETGAGKTTAMLSLLRLVPSPPGVVSSKKILVNGLDLTSLSPKELGTIRGKEIAMIFQDPMSSLNPVLTVGEQIAESILLHNPVSAKEALNRAKDILGTVGISPERYNEYPHQFSGGMRQRIGIAIALACEPAILIADEPTTALDVTIQAQVLRLMRELREKFHTSMLLITHDLGIVAEMCDEVAVMYAGRIVERGTAEDLFNNFKHPYTEGLFDSLPNIKHKVTRLKPIKGQMPDPSNLPKGCAFAPRCPYAMPECELGQPPERKISDTHMVACIAYNNPEFKLKRSR